MERAKESFLPRNTHKETNTSDTEEGPVKLTEKPPLLSGLQVRIDIPDE